MLVLVLASAAIGTPAAAQLPTLPGTPTTATSTTTTAPPPPPTTAAPPPTTRRPRATTTTEAPGETTTTAAPATTTTITERVGDEPEFDIETLDAEERDGTIVVRTTVRNLGDGQLDVAADVRVVGDADERLASGRFVLRGVPPGKRKGGSVEVAVDGDAAGVVVTYRAPATTKVARTDLGVPTAIAATEQTDDRRGLLLLVGGGLVAALWAVLRAQRQEGTDEER